MDHENPEPAGLPPGALEAAAARLRRARHVVALTGAGMSVESGIPPFRGGREGAGLWDKYDPMEYGTLAAFLENPGKAWRMLRELGGALAAAQPHEGHRALARMEAAGMLHGIITQNIDGLHQASGLPDDKVIELHGNTTYAVCLDCSRRYELDWVREIFADGERLPVCTACGGHIKTATVSFGQAMPPDAMERAQAATLAADLFMVLGSSLVVYPAAGFPITAKRNGARLVIVNRDPTDQDRLADLVIHAEIGPVMSRAV
jgi:NAD-dependent deacetylase